MSRKQEWWRGGVIYQIYPRSFFDSNGDGIGDLAGITQKLDYIASLGVDGVWISPFFTSPMADFGYDVADYQNIDPIFGTLADFDVLLTEMHKRGLKLIIDLVLNHTSIAHPWFREKPDWYVWADKPNNWLSVFGGSAWEYDAARKKYYFHQFLKEQPDLNVRHPEVQAELLRIAEWWLERGVDGFRLDALNHCIHDAQLRDNPLKDGVTLGRAADGSVVHPYNAQWHRYDKSQPEMIPFIKKFRALADRYDDRFLVAEVNDDTTIQTTVSYTNGPELLHTAYNFSLLGPLCSAEFLRKTVEEFFAKPHDAWPSWAFSNHDSIRSATRLGVDPKMLMALLLSLKGTPFIYEGEELGLIEASVPKDKQQDPGLGSMGTGRDGCRTPMPWERAEKNAGFSQGEPWLPVPPEHAALCVSAQEKDPDSMLNFTRDFLRWRKNIPALRWGNIKFVSSDNNVLIFERSYEGKTVVCTFDLSGGTYSIK